MINRRNFQILAAGLVLGAGGLAPRAQADSKTFRIALQKGAGNLIFLKERGILERKLAPFGWTVTWTEFQAGPQLLESLNVGATDFGLVGEAPPIFAQAAGAKSYTQASNRPRRRTKRSLSRKTARSGPWPISRESVSPSTRVRTSTT